MAIQPPPTIINNRRMAKDKAEDLRKQIENEGIVVPKGLDEAKLKECLAIVKSGASQGEVDELYGVEKPPAPPEKPVEPKEPTVTMAQMKVLLEEASAEAAKKAIEEFRKSEPQQARQEPTVVHVDSSKNAKPREFDSKAVPPEDFMAKPFRVLHMNNGDILDMFRIDGRRVPPPYSMFLVFEPYHGPETNRYGDAANLVSLCVHVTHSRKVMELFKSDERWGGEYWTAEGIVENEKVQLQAIVIKVHAGLSGVDHAGIKKMANDRGIKSSNLPDMRLQIAMYEAEKELDILKKAKQAVDAADKKEALMVQNQ